MAEIKNFPNNVDEYIGAQNVMKWLHGRSSGVFGADGNLSVTANGDMTVSVSDGVGWLANDKADGTVFWNDTKEQTGSELQLTIPLADPVLPRIDRIVVSWDTVDYASKPRIEVLKGTPNSAPTAPGLTNNTLKRQISLARVGVAAAVSSISADSITDERLDPDVCGLVTDWVSVDTTTIQSQFSALLEKVKTELAQLHDGTAIMTKAQYDPAGGGLNVCVQEYECVKKESVYALTGNGAVGRFKVPTAWNVGDTWTVNGKAVPAYCGADAVDSDCIVAGRWVLFTFDGQRLDFNGGGGLSSGKLAQATAAESDVLSGKKFYAGNKNLKTGTMHNNGRWPDAEKFTLEGNKIWMYQKQNGYTEGGLGSSASQLGNASPSNVLRGVSASSSNGIGFSGTMANNGAWGSNVAMNSSVTIPKGYHNGSGKVNGPSITNRGNWGSTINPGGSVTVPQGYHSGGGKVTARAVNANDAIGKIQYATTTDRYVSDSHKYILGVANVNAASLSSFYLQFYLSSDHHTATWADAPGSSWTYAYIDV